MWIREKFCKKNKLSAIFFNNAIDHQQPYLSYLSSLVFVHWFSSTSTHIVIISILFFSILILLNLILVYISNWEFSIYLFPPISEKKKKKFFWKQFSKKQFVWNFMSNCKSNLVVISILLVHSMWTISCLCFGEISYWLSFWFLIVFWGKKS